MTQNVYFVEYPKEVASFLKPSVFQSRESAIESVLRTWTDKTPWAVHWVKISDDDPETTLVTVVNAFTGSKGFQFRIFPIAYHTKTITFY